MDLSRLEC